MVSPIKVVGTLLRWTAPVVVIAGGALIAKELIDRREAPPKVDPPPRVLPVDVITVERRDNPASLQVFGTVRPLRTLVLRPTVGGPIQQIPILLTGPQFNAARLQRPGGRRRDTDHGTQQATRRTDTVRRL